MGAFISNLKVIFYCMLLAILTKFVVRRYLYLAVYLSEFLVNLIKMVKKALEQLDTQSRIQAPNRSSYTMHTQLRQSSINRPHTHRTRQHGSNRTSRPRIIPNLEHLQLCATLVCYAL